MTSSTQNNPAPAPKKRKTNGTQIAVHTPPLSSVHPQHLITLPTESEISEVDEDDLDESLFDRVSALKDIVPPTYRKSIANASSTGYSWASRALSLGGKTLWVVSTSALLLGVPWALAFSEEQQVQEMEREMRMQQSANEVCRVSCQSDDEAVRCASYRSADQCAIVASYAGCWTAGREGFAVSAKGGPGLIT